MCANQRDGSFGLYMPKAYQKNRPFGLCRGNLYIISQKKSGLPDDEAIPIFEYLRKCM